MRQAMEAHDPAGLEASIAEGAVLHSPVLSEPFEGKPAVSNVVIAVRDLVEEFRVERQFSDGEVDSMVFSGSIRGEPMQAVAVFSFNDQDLVRDCLIFFRPLRAISAFFVVAGPRLAKSKRRGRALRVGAPMFALAAWLTVRVAQRNVWMR